MTLLLIIIYISFISLGLPDSLLGSAWPVMYGELQVPVSFAGIISMIIAGGTIISSFFSEKIIRRLGTGPVTAISVFMTAAALLGFSLSHSAWLLCILAVPYGLGAGSVDAALNNFVALHYKAHHMSWLHCFWGIGATAGPFIMSLCLNTGKSWHSGYMTIALIQIILTVFLFLSLPLWKKQQAGTATEENGVQNTSLSPFPGCCSFPGPNQPCSASLAIVPWKPLPDCGEAAILCSPKEYPQKRPHNGPHCFISGSPSAVLSAVSFP